MSTTIELYCWVLGEESGHIFPVKIASTESVGNLKEAIKDKKRPQFDHIPADTLVLRKVSIHFDSNLERNLENLDLDGVPPLSPWLKLSSVFSNKPTDDCLQVDIIVKAPIDHNRNIQLNCLVFGESPDYIFPVEIALTKTVWNLKEAIKDKMKHTFEHVDAGNLALWKISFPVTGSLQEDLSKHEFVDEELLSPVEELSDVFSEPHVQKNLHIVVKPPPVTVHTKVPKNVLLTTPKLGMRDTSIDEFLGTLRPKIKEFLSHPRHRIWMPPEAGDANTRQFYHNLAIPSINNKPNLLLHRLDEETNPNTDILFQYGTHHRILCNTSGARKTALVFNGLCSYWGFYFAAAQDTNMIGAQDLELAIEMMSQSPQWIWGAVTADVYTMLYKAQQRVIKFEDASSDERSKTMALLPPD